MCQGQTGKKRLDAGTPLHRDGVEAYGLTWDETLRDLWADSSLTLEDIALRLCGKRRSEQRIKIEAERLGLPFPRRYKTCRAAGVYIKRNGASASQHPTKIKQSSQAVLRDKKKQWLDILEKNPKALRTEIREKFSSLYKWLNKQSRKWLRKHLPPRKDHSFDWAGLDDSLAIAVAESAERIKSAETPRRVTLFAVGQDIDSYDYLRKHAGTLPKTARVLRQVLETRLEFTKRKIHMTALTLRERGLMPTQVSLIKEAKVSRDLIRDSEVQALIDSETCHPGEIQANMLAA